MPRPRSSAVWRVFGLCLPLSLLLTAVGLLGACGRGDSGQGDSGDGDALPAYNLLLLSVDSLRADRLALWTRAWGREGEGVATPALARLAERGVLFSNVWAVAPWTAPSMVSVFTGLYPPSHGAIARDDTTPLHLDTLPRMARSKGYAVGNFSFFAGISYFRNLGFGEPVRGLGHGREPQVLARWLDEEVGDRPFFAWIHLLEPHLPYGATGYRAKELQIEGSSGLERSQLQATVPVGTVEFEEGDRQRLLGLYDSDIEKLDQRIAEIETVLLERELADSTLIIFVADHGEELLDDGWVGHASTSTEAKLIPAILRIPLLFAGPAVELGATSDALVQQVDILPTVTSLLGWPEPARTDGRVLLGAGPGWLGGLWGRNRERSHAFIDSSVGGNLTPIERRSERLQGVTDGECLLRVSSVPGEPERSELVSLVPFVPPVSGGTCRGVVLAEALAEWREEQLQQRLEILREDSQEGAPPIAEIEGYKEAIDVFAPLDHSELSWEEEGGLLALEWTARAAKNDSAEPAAQDDETRVFWIQYEVGAGVLAVEGTFRVEQRRVVFGPFPQGFWNDLAGYSPFRFRVLDAERKERSRWLGFRMVRSG